MAVTVEFCGEEFRAPDDAPLTIGRVADVEIDDNPYLHRVFLQVHREHELWCRCTRCLAEDWDAAEEAR